MKKLTLIFTCALAVLLSFLTVSAQTTITLDADSSQPIRPLLGVNIGPVSSGTGNPDVTAQYKQAGVTQIRTHDFYGAFDMAQIYPNQSADPTNPASYNFTNSDRIFAAIINGGFEPYLRIGYSYNNVQRVTNRANWTRAAIEMVRRYSDANRWGANYLRYIEIWNEPDNGHFLLNTREEFFQIFAETAFALRAEFPNLKIGGGAFSPAGFLASQGQNFVRGFLNYMQQNNVPLDFLSWHIYSNNPQDFANAAIFYRAELDSRGYTATESHITEWNTEFRDPARDDSELRTGAKASALMTAAWINLQNQNVAVSTFYRGTDPSMDAPWFYGIFYANGIPKPVGLAFQLWKQTAQHPKRVNVNLNNTNLSVLAGRNANGEFCFLISNPTATPTSWQIALPVNTSPFLIKIQEIKSPATAITTTSLSNLSSTIDAYAVQLVTVRLRKWRASR